MAEVVEDFTFPDKKPLHPDKYPWPEWFDGKCRRLKHGEDFTIRTDLMRSGIQTKARKRRLKVRVHADGHDLYVQVYGQLTEEEYNATRHVHPPKNKKETNGDDKAE